VPKDLSWDGNPSSFEVYVRKVQGHLSCNQIGYFLDPHFNKQYLALGNDYFDTDDFSQRFPQIHPHQPPIDNEYLFGLLQQTTTHELPALVKWGPTRDGLRVWNNWQSKYLNSGSDVLKARELQLAITGACYKGKTLREIPRFLDDFMTSLSKLEGIQAKRCQQGHAVHTLGEEEKKMYLFHGLRTAPGLFGSLIMQLQWESQSNPNITFDAIVKDIQQQVISAEYDNAPPHCINMATKESVEMTREEFLTLYHSMASINGHEGALKTLSNPILRKNLKIPNDLLISFV
jgi:hypothetical protein